MNENSSKVIFWALLLTYESTLYLFMEARYEHLKFFTNKNASNFETMSLRCKIEWKLFDRQFLSASFDV